MSSNTCLDGWIDHIVTLTLRGSLYRGQAINGFKESNRSKLAYNWLIAHIKESNPSFTLDVTNLEKTLLNLIFECDPKLFSVATFQFLTKCTQNKKILSADLSTDEITRITGLLNEAKSSFDELAGDDTPGNTTNATNTNNEPSPSQQVISATLPSYMSDFNNNSIVEELRGLKETFNTKISEINAQLAGLTSKKNYENKSFNELINILGYKIKKLLLAEHGLTIQNYHLNQTNNSCPAQLSVKNFFEPYCYSTNFLTKMEVIYNDSINKIMDEIVIELNDRITSLKAEIEKIKLSLERFKTKEEILKLAEDQKLIEQTKLKSRFKQTLNKSKRSKRIPFLIHFKNLINDDTMDENNTLLDQNINQQNSKITNKNNNVGRARSTSKSSNKSRTSSKNSSQRITINNKTNHRQRSSDTLDQSNNNKSNYFKKNNEQRNNNSRNNNNNNNNNKFNKNNNNNTNYNNKRVNFRMGSRKDSLI